MGPAPGGLLGEYFGMRVPFFVGGGLAAANALFGYFVPTESLPLERRRAFDLRRANPLGELKVLKRYLALMRLAHNSLPATWSYYTMLKFSWTTGEVGLSLVAVGVLSTISYAVLPRLLTPWLRENKCFVLGLLAGALGYSGYAIAPNPAVLYAVMVMFCFGGVAGATFNAILSHIVPNNEQGDFQGAIASVGSVTAIAAPLIMTGVFATFTAAQAPVYFPGGPFLAAPICELGALGVFAAAMARKAKTV